MADIYIVNHSISGPYAQCFSSYHHTEAEAALAFEECKASSGEDPCLIELVHLDTVTLDVTTINGWEGTWLDLEDEKMEDEGEE